ncbi:MAG: nitroreductase family protein [Elusimicrobiota bacterium]
MDVKKAIRTRRSVRNYREEKKVEEEKLTEVLQAGRLAPSASNRQEWRYVVVKDSKTRQKLSQAAGQSQVAEAPVVIACCAVTDQHVMSCGQKCYPIDLAISIDHMTLQAAELGLGTCWIGAFDPQKVKNILGIPEEVEVVEMLTLGYPKDRLTEKPKDRLALSEIVKEDKWS